ncbi:MAG TPA: hypothetical protein VGG05_08325 [Pseudonocardiaceae bacterium]
MARMEKLGQLIESGCTIVLDTLDALDPTMEITCQALQWWAHELVQVNVYLTTAEAAGFNLHWDDHGATRGRALRVNSRIGGRRCRMRSS